MSAVAKPSWIVRTTGITAATAASKRSWTPLSRAIWKSSSPCWASSCLFAVTTGRPARIAAATYSRAGSVPPISSTIRSEPSRISAKSPSLRVRTPASCGRRPVAASTASARASSNSAKAAPTLPRPSRPMRTGFGPSPTSTASPVATATSDIAGGEVVEGLAADDDAGLAARAEDHRRGGDAVVVGGHRVAVGAGRRGDEDLADDGRREHRVADDHVARLAVHPGDGDERVGLGEDAVGDQGLVAGPVEHRSQVVGHTAVDGEVCADPGDLLDRADAVGGDAGVGDQRAPRLDHHPHVGPEDLAHAVDLDADVVVDRGRAIVLGVGDAEAAADVDDLAPVAGQLTERGDRQLVGLELEDLRADVGVQPDQVQLLGGEDALDRPRRPGRVAGPEAELRVELAGGDVVVGRGLDPRGDPDQHLHRLVEEALAALDLVEGVEDQVADSGPRRHQDLLVGLVVAVHVDPGRVEPRGERDVELAAGGDVDRQPLLGEELVGGGGREGLARVEDLAVDAAALEGLAVGAGTGAHVVLGVDVGGGAVLFGELDHVAAADL